MANQNEMTEGEARKVTLSKYERNLKARKACLAYYGTSCAVCGMDFGKLYGPEFTDIIEVHHIVPVSEIGKRYVVDPVKDLIPVCPNCHTALHSKPGGVYTVEELKSLKNQDNNREENNKQKKFILNMPCKESFDSLQGVF